MKRKQVFKLVFTLEFMIACVIVGLEFMHNKNILQRDIKPENLVFDKNGTYIF